MIETVLFDLAEVYINGIVGLELNIADQLGFTAKEVHDHLRQPELTLMFEGKISEEDYWKAIIQHNNYPPVMRFKQGDMPTAKFLNQAARSNFTEVEGTAGIVQRLKLSGYRIGLVSDHAREWVKHYEEHFPINHLFKSRCYSFEEGITKINPEIYKRALKRAGGRPGTTLYIDDRMSNIQIATSKAVGIRYWHQFTDASNLEEALKEMNVKLL